MKIALYARVSTADKDQNPENQLIVLRKEAVRAGNEICKESTKTRAVKVAARLSKMMRDAQKRRFDMVRV